MNGQFTLLYDSACPICRGEITWLRRRDRSGNLQVEDIAAQDFDPSRYGLTSEEVSRVLHGIMPDGVVLKGMDAVREAYRAVGLGWIVAPTRFPGLKALSDFLYRSFAKHRIALGRLLQPSCSADRCSVSPTSETRQ